MLNGVEAPGFIASARFLIVAKTLRKRTGCVKELLTVILVDRLARRGRLCLTIARSALRHGGIEEARRVAKRNTARAVRRTAVGFALYAFVTTTISSVPAPSTCYRPAQEDTAAAIKRQQIGRAISFACHDEHSAALQRGIGDQRVPDNDRRHPVRQSQNFGLVDDLLSEHPRLVPVGR